MVESYIPARGDLVYLDFDPQAGHEQAGRRPALVISPRLYNQQAGLCIVCPITSREKGYPFEVKIVGQTISGVVLSDQMKSCDWQARKIKFVESLGDDDLEQVMAKLALLVQ